MPKLAQGDASGFPFLLAESRTPLWSEADPRERRLQLGKVQNLRLAAARIDRVSVPERGEFSFWSQVGMPSSGRGYAQGRQIQEGCVVPAVAGGICQLSNALHDATLRAGFEVTERHAHTRALPSAPWSAGRDATVAWNHVDYRFRAPVPAMVRVTLTSDELVVQLLGARAFSRESRAASGEAQTNVEGCETCGMVRCWRHRSFSHAEVKAKTAWLVDQVWPEFAAYFASSGQDALYVPLDGKRRGVARYAWPTGGVRVFEARLLTLRRSLASRRLSEQGAARQRSNMEFDRAFAERFASRLSFDVQHVVVSQTLLPYLWATGALGGRTYEVLMVRRPMRALQAALDEEFAKHPSRRLLSDFRAPGEVVEAEEAALASATKVVTPHAEIASAFGDRAVLLDWSLPSPRGVWRGDRVAFPGPTVARKGAYELREAARELGLKLVLCGSELEGEGFWDGVDAVRARTDWLDGCCAVVQPAVLEDQPRKLLRAVAEGVPVVATPACGVSHMPGVTTVPVGDVAALSRALRLYPSTPRG